MISNRQKVRLFFRQIVYIVKAVAWKIRSHEKSVFWGVVEGINNCSR